MSWDTDDFTSDEEYDPNTGPANNNSGVIDYSVMTPDGVPADKGHLLQNIKQYKLCEACNRYFDPTMIDDSDNFVKCTHCWFFFKEADYDNGKVSDFEVDSLITYIKTYGEDHNPEKCTRNSDSGSCFLCRAKIDYLPDVVKKKMNAEKAKKAEIKKKREQSNDVFLAGNEDMHTSSILSKMGKGVEGIKRVKGGSFIMTL